MIERWAIRFLTRRGYIVLAENAVHELQDAAVDLADTIEVSGHFNQTGYHAVRDVVRTGTRVRLLAAALNGVAK